MNRKERCSIPHCKGREVEVVLMGKNLCEKHWQEIAGGNEREEEAEKATEIAKKGSRRGKV